MFGFDDIFDFDHDGHLDAVERDAEYQFMYEMTKSGYKVSAVASHHIKSAVKKAARE